MKKKKKRLGDSNTNGKNIHPAYRNGIWLRRMHLADYE